MSATRLNADIRKKRHGYLTSIKVDLQLYFSCVFTQMQWKQLQDGARTVLLNSVLCFLVNKFGKVDIKSLKTALFDFCDVDTAIIEGEVTVNERSNQIK